MAKFGWYSTLREASSDISTDDQIKSMQAVKVFASILYNRLQNRVEYKTNIAIAEQSKVAK